MRISYPCLIAASLLAGCGATRGRDWVGEFPREGSIAREDGAWRGREDRERVAQPSEPWTGDALPLRDEPIAVKDFGDGVPRAMFVAPSGDALFRNTYYDFPLEADGPKEATVYDAACTVIAKVTRDFHDRVCVQGSGRLGGGATVSYAKRDCACADTCPRTGQKICYERLDPARFPHGRGATGRAITPLRTVAVDSTVIPLGTLLFIPEFVGLPRIDGRPHDGCFLAEDRGLKVVGRQIDVFTGDPTITTRWNSLLPSNRGVHVVQNDGRCKPGGS